MAHQNTLFSVYALTDANEDAVERYRYDGYGGCAVLDADGSADADGLSDLGNPYAFTGRRLDLESDLMQYRHRYYSPTLGRFISRDPQEHLRAFNLYEYATGNPVFNWDPMGLESIGIPGLIEIRYEPPCYYLCVFGNWCIRLFCHCQPGRGGGGGGGGGGDGGGGGGDGDGGGGGGGGGGGDDGGGGGTKTWVTVAVWSYKSDERHAAFARASQCHKEVTNHAGVAAYLGTLDDEGMCARWLWYVDHGEPGRQGIGYSKVTTSAISSICPYLCENAVVVLGGCSVGKGPPGDRYLTDLFNACPRIYVLKACRHDMWYSRDTALCGIGGQEDWNVRMRGAK